jgi:DNA-binding transcriptional regulator PaaX
MPKKDLTLGSKILIWALTFEDVLLPWRSYQEMRRAIRGGRRNSLDVAVYRLYKRGWIKFVDKQGDRFFKLTKNGEIEALLAKARLPEHGSWDGKWRIIFFDIPEAAKEKRNLLRSLLKKNNFKKMQASVYASPYVLNREAIKYLKETKLNEFIKIAKVEELDDDKGLRRSFGLPKK